LSALRRMTTADAEAYLCSLPGVGVKSARCVLMYSLGREVFPVDIHSLRIMHRLGWVDWQGQRAESVADAAQRGVPPGLRKALHALLVQHGRLVCKSRPRCASCILRAMCPSGQ
jgi:endonuclease-3